MSVTHITRPPVTLRHPTSLFIDGRWTPASAGLVDVIDSGTEEVFLQVGRAGADNVEAAVAAARRAFDDGPWPRLTHHERADWLRRFARALRGRGDEAADLWSRESGVLNGAARGFLGRVPGIYETQAALADTFDFNERREPTAGGAAAYLRREPVGVVAAIVPWNIPVSLSSHKLAPALLAGCTVVLKASPEAPGALYVLAEVAEEIGLPPGVLNVLTADRDVSEELVVDPRVDKVTFTGSTDAGRRIGALCADRVARCTLELGGKSAAVVLPDYDVEQAARSLVGAITFISGQVCSALTRVIVPRDRHDQMVEAIAAHMAAVTVGDPFDPASAMGPLAVRRQRDRVLGFIEQGVRDGAQLAHGGSRPTHLERGWFVEPTVFGRVENSSQLAQEEIFGPVLAVIAADDDDDAVRLANDSRFGLNASVFTHDLDKAIDVGSRLQSGTVGHNAYRTDFGLAFGGYKQSGYGREGGREGIRAYLETKALILDADPEA